METTKENIMAIIIKFLLLVAGFLGLYFTFSTDNFMAQSNLLFFTIQSNIAIVLIVLVFLIFDILKICGKITKIPNCLYIIKLALTIGITLTFLVFSILLTPTMVASGKANYLASVSNICLHNLVPILAILDWILFDYNANIKKYTFLYGTIFPFCYMIFAFVAGALGANFGEGSTVPYFFMDYTKLSWFNINAEQFGVFYWIIILIFVVMLIGWTLSKITKIRQGKLNKQL